MSHTTGIETAAHATIEPSKLFSQFESVRDSLVNQFVSLIPKSFSEALRLLLLQDNKDTVSEAILENRKQLKRHIEKFHLEAGTNYGNITETMKLLDDSDSKIMVSTHQPNLFPYGGVFKKVVLLENLRRAVYSLNPDFKMINLFIIIDHDFIDETWVRNAQLPSMQTETGIMELRLPVSEAERWRLIRNVPLPSTNVILHWERQILSWIKTHMGSDPNLAARLYSNFDNLWTQFRCAYSKAKSYSDLNSFLMSLITNESWQYETLFVRLSDMSEVIQNGFDFLVHNAEPYSSALQEIEQSLIASNIDTGVSPNSYSMVPLWHHCGCGSKASLKILTSSERKQLKLQGECIGCKKSHQIHLPVGQRLRDITNINDISPKAIAIPLLLSLELGITYYSSGTGGLGYIVDAMAISRKLRIRWPQILVWPSRDISKGIVQQRAQEVYTKEALEELSRDNDKIISQMQSSAVAIRSLATERAELAKSGSPIDGVLKEMLKLKEEQRDMRRRLDLAKKIANIQALSPCIVDYSVNHGLSATEQQWTKHLLETDNLFSPVLF